jgi:predicted Rossmann fold flavoprotein
MERFDVAIIGAGAAGLMCAIEAGKRGRRVLLLDHDQQAGSKILISGGGRCNFTNLGTRADRFLSRNKHFCKSALARYTPQDFLALVNKHGIAWHEKTLGQLFCNGSARQIVAMLLGECEAAGVTLRLGQHIGEIARADRFRIATGWGDIAAESLVLATGGLSIPKMGATGFAYDIARQFGLSLTERLPGLVPLTLDPATLASTASLSGVSLPVIAKTGKTAFAEAMLFTHRGVSGPAILQISSYWQPGEPVTLDLLPGAAPGFLLARKKPRARAQLQTVLAEFLPQRLAAFLAPPAIASRAMGELPDQSLRALEASLKAWQLAPNGTEGYAKAEVTLGGVDTASLSSQTLEARDVPGLFVIGEAVDVTGWLGGYNFQWAWSSGWCAGQAV